MRKIDILKTSWSNLKRNKTRSTLTIIAVFVGSATIMTTNSVGSGIKSYLDAQIGMLGDSRSLITTQKSTTSENANSPQKYDPTKVRAQPSGLSTPESSAGGSPFSSAFLLTQADISKLTKEPGVTSVKPLLSLLPDYITTGQGKYLIATQPAIVDSVSYSLAAGQNLDKSSTENQVLLPTFYLGALGFDSAQQAVGKNITLAVSDQLGNRKDFTAEVVGVVNKSFVSSNNLILNRSFTEKAVAYQDNGKPEASKNIYTAAIVKYQDSYSDQQLKTLQKDLEEQGYNAVTIKDQQKIVFNIVDAVIMVLNLFGVVALTAASFGIINTLYMAVQERTKEIGLMKAVGMGRGKIFALFSIEAAFLGLIGSTVGVLFAMGLGRVINNVASNGILKDFEGLQLLTFEFTSVITVIGVVTLIAFLAGTLPARKASKLDPIEALRYE